MVPGKEKHRCKNNLQEKRYQKTMVTIAISTIIPYGTKKYERFLFIANVEPNFSGVPRGNKVYTTSWPSGRSAEHSWSLQRPRRPPGSLQRPPGSLWRVPGALKAPRRPLESLAYPQGLRQGIDLIDLIGLSPGLKSIKSIILVRVQVRTI